MGQNLLPRWMWVGFFTTALVGTMGYLMFPEYVSDSDHYIALAEGAQSVSRPWGARILHPFLARLLAQTTKLPLEASFRILTLLGLVTFCLSFSYLCHRLVGNPWWALLGLGAGVAPAAAAIYLNDLFFLGLTGVFLVAVELRWSLVMISIAALLGLTREVGVLLSVIACRVFWVQRRRLLAAAVLSMGLVGWLAADRVVAPPGTNVHALPAASYFLGHGFVSLLRNLAGFQVWTNTLAELWKTPGRGGCVEPLLQYALPLPLRMGNVTSVGICPWEPGYIVTFFLLMGAALGVVPAIAWTQRKRLIQSIRNGPPVIAIAGAYGGTVYVAMPVITAAAVGRLILYAAPLAGIALPWAFHQLWHRLSARWRLVILSTHVTLIAVAGLYLWRPISLTYSTLAMASAMLAQFAVARWLSGEACRGKARTNQIQEAAP